MIYDVIIPSIPFMFHDHRPDLCPDRQTCKLHCISNTTVHCNIHNHNIICTKSRIEYIKGFYISVALMICTHSIFVYIYGVCYISGQWELHPGWVFHICTSVTYLDYCYIFRRWMFHIWTSVTYLDDGGYISGRFLPIWTMGFTDPLRLRRVRP